jgi:hypothetical protein
MTYSTLLTGESWLFEWKGFAIRLADRGAFGEYSAGATFESGVHQIEIPPFPVARAQKEKPRNARKNPNQKNR